MKKLRQLWRWLLPGLQAAWLPGLLAVIFVAQHAAFDNWLGISPALYRRMLPASLALGLLAYGPAVFLRGRWRTCCLTVTSVIVSVLLLGEYLYYSYSASYLQVTAFLYLGQAGSFVGAATSHLQPRLLLFVANVLLVAWVSWRPRRRLGPWQAPAPLNWRLNALLAALLLAGIIGGYGQLLIKEKREYGDLSRLFVRLYDLDAVVGRMGILNYFTQDAVKRVLFSDRVTAQDRAFVQEWHAAQVPAVPGESFGSAKGRNLILIQVESLEDVVIDAKVGGIEVTPRLNALAREGLYFSRYYAPVGLGNTADAEFMTLNSLYPLPNSVAFVSRPHNSYVALPRLLADHGYATSVFHGDVATFWNRAGIYPALGYQQWFMKDFFKPTRDLSITGIGDEDLFNQSLAKLKTMPQPFMATIMTLISHVPFYLPDDLRTFPIPADTNLDETQRHYLETVNYTDRVLGDFIDGLKRDGLYDNSVIAIFGDHGSYTDISRALGDTQDGLADKRVPLIILAPGTGLVGERTMPSSHLDLYPTLAHLLGLAAPANALGQDLLVSQKPAFISRQPGTDTLDAAVGAEVSFVAATDGIFEHGSCRDTETQATVPIERCHAFVTEQADVLKASDLMIRGNLIAPPATVAP